MEKINYQKIMEEQIASLTGTPSLLLHSCCGPCSSYVLEVLSRHFNVTVLYYNPNIEPFEEYQKRLSEQLRLIKEAEFKKTVRLLMEKTAALANENGFDFITTTRAVSPHINAALLNKIGEELSQKYGVPYLFADFKKKEGYKRSIELSKKYELYRQNYCGCLFSQNLENGGE